MKSNRPAKLVHIRGVETYVMLFPPEKFEAAIHGLGSWADDPSLPYTWFDAAIGARTIRKRFELVRPATDAGALR